MKKNTIRPLAAMAVASVMMFGCASSGDTTATGTEAPEAVVVEETVVAVKPIATLSSTTLVMENTVPVGEMFEDIEDTEQYDVLALAKTSPNLSTFVKLIEAADMENDFQRMDAMTLFAPTNEAFAEIPKDKLEMLLMSDKKAILMRMIQAHILPSEVSSTQFSSNQQIELTPDRHIPVNVGMGGTTITVGGATIIRPNIEASNGILHVVDAVIVPSEDALRDEFGIY